MLSASTPLSRICIFLCAAALLASSGCSTVVEGSSQKITVRSAPPGALCLLKQADEIVGRVTTPGSAVVDKTKNDLVIYCSKPGYVSVSFRNRSDFAMANLGNAVFWQLSFVGSAIDSVSGANNKYTPEVFVRLTPATTPVAFPLPPEMQPLAPAPSLTTNMWMPPPMPGAPKALMPEAAAVPAPEVPAVAEGPVTDVTAIDPAKNAPASLAEIALKHYAQQQTAPMTYAQEIEPLPHKRPFE